MFEATLAQALEAAVQHHRAGRLREAEAIYQQILIVDPNHAEALHLQGVVALQTNRHAMGVDLIRRSLAIAPNYAFAYNSLGNALSDVGRTEEATAAYQRALALNPNIEEAHNNLGVMFKDAGRLDESIAAHRRALEINPSNVVTHSNWVYTLYFHPAYTARAILQEHQEWNRRHAARFAAQIPAHPNDRSPERRLRIGYVSPNLRAHVVGRFMLPLLAAHDHTAFEIYCYDNSHIPDHFTQVLRVHADVWREVAPLTDEQLAALIQQDRIDILVDLTMHLQNNRLLAFARKPAPVQVTYLAYCGTTGLNTIDYRLTDPYLDPDPAQDDVYTEKSVRLPRTYWCYDPCPEAMAEPEPRREGPITFISLNNFCKVSDIALETWGKILAHMPGSRLILHSVEGSHRARVLAILSRAGITADRVEFIARIPRPAYFDLYRRADIALDSFPHAGGTTTCDALWMGVPVVTLSGQTAVGRGGVSILSNIGCTELIAHSPDEYLSLAIALAHAPEKLRVFRAELRNRMRNSPLMDPRSFARDVENAFRNMWRIWCASARPLP